MPSDQEFENELKLCFIEDAEPLLEEIESHLLDNAIEPLVRILHNLKGGAQSVGFEPFARVVHEWETLVAEVRKQGAVFSPAQLQVCFRWRDGLVKLLGIYRQDPSAQPEIADLLAAAPPVAETLRVPRASIDLLVDNLGEMGVLHAGLRQLLGDLSAPLPLRRALDQWENLLHETQRVAFGLSLVPIRPLFQKMRRVVKDVSDQLGKKVELELIGQETEIEKSLLDRVADPLMHLIRNAIDHGIEPLEERRRLGKPEIGRITLRAYHRGDRVGIECRDDGAGLNAEKLVARARSKNLIDPRREISPAEALELIFLPGFSTADAVTDISGRGIGMDVVKTNVAALGGHIEIETEPGRGTCFRLRLPYHLALLDALLVRVDEETYAIPLTSLEEVVERPPADVSTFDLGELLAEKPVVSSTVLMVRDRAGTRCGLRVSEVLSRKEVLMKRASAELPRPWISGYTILGDGKVSLVLDVQALMGGPEAAA